MIQHSTLGDVAPGLETSPSMLFLLSSVLPHSVSHPERCSEYLVYTPTYKFISNFYPISSYLSSISPKFQPLYARHPARIMPNYARVLNPKSRLNYVRATKGMMPLLPTDLRRTTIVYPSDRHLPCRATRQKQASTTPRQAKMLLQAYEPRSSWSLSVGDSTS